MRTPTNSLIRIGIIAFAPVAINAGMLLGLFGMACCMGPCLDDVLQEVRFGSCCRWSCCRYCHVDHYVRSSLVP